MSTENKPREYFDKWVPYYGNYLNGDASIQEQSQRYSIDQQAIVRVIEYRAVEQLKAELRTSDLNRQSLWADSVKMADELNFIKAKHTAEITALKSENEKLYAARKEFSRNDWRTFGALALENEQLKSKLEVAKKGLEFYADGEGDVLDWSGVNNSAYIQVKGKRAKQTLLEIEDVE